jgi:perosamine synthetase
MSGDELAVLGGTPVRTRPFLVRPMVDESEERLVVDAIRNDNFSRYIGLGGPDIESVLRMTSADAIETSDYWHFLGGPNVRAFAAEFARRFDVPFAIPVSSATVGIGTALAACGIGPGDEVILPALSFSATANAVLMFNAIPVFVDVDPETFCLDPEKLEAAITPHTRAVLPVHLVGNICDMAVIVEIARRYGLKIVEDACQAIGATWRGRHIGSIGDAGVFSFQQSKNIMTGEGGMIVTHDPEVARRARLILNHGETVLDDRMGVEDLANIVGLNFRMPELCAAVGRAQLRKLNEVNAWRTRNADQLRDELASLPGLRVARSFHRPGDETIDVPHVFVALLDENEMGVSRDLFVHAVRAEGVPVGTGYARTLYASPTFLKKTAYGSKGCPWTCGHYKGHVSYSVGMCPVAEDLLERRFVWFYHIAHASTPDDIADVGKAVRKVVSRRGILASHASRLSNQLGTRHAGRIGVAPEQVRGR